MSLKGPNDDDLTKLHAEANQIVAHRLTLHTLAITIFTAVAAWIVPKDPNPIDQKVGALRYCVSILLVLVEFALFLLSYHLTSMLRTITAYLFVTGKSDWESDWRKYRERNPSYWGYTKPQTIIFLLMGLLAGIFPFVYGIAFGISLQPLSAGILSLCVTLLYLLLVWGMGFRQWFAREDILRKRWESLKAETEGQ